MKAKSNVHKTWRSKRAVHPVNDPREHFEASPLWLPPEKLNAGRRGFNRAIDSTTMCCSCGNKLKDGPAARLCYDCDFDMRTSSVYVTAFEVTDETIVFQCPNPDCEMTVQLVRDFGNPMCRHLIGERGQVYPRMVCPYGCMFDQYIRFIYNTEHLKAAGE